MKKSKFLLVQSHTGCLGWWHPRGENGFRYRVLGTPSKEAMGHGVAFTSMTSTSSTLQFYCLVLGRAQTRLCVTKDSLSVLVTILLLGWPLNFGDVEAFSCFKICHHYVI